MGRNDTVGVKTDHDKVRLDLVPVSGVIGPAVVLTFGAAKYGDRNWERGIAWSRVYAALQRHLFAFWGGEDLDPESGLPHVHHAGCCIMFLSEFLNTHPELDDRPRKGAV